MVTLTTSATQNTTTAWQEGSRRQEAVTLTEAQQELIRSLIKRLNKNDPEEGKTLNTLLEANSSYCDYIDGLQTQIDEVQTELTKLEKQEKSLETQAASQDKKLGIVENVSSYMGKAALLAIPLAPFFTFEVIFLTAVTAIKISADRFKSYLSENKNQIESLQERLKAMESQQEVPKRGKIEHKELTSIPKVETSLNNLEEKEKQGSWFSLWPFSCRMSEKEQAKAEITAAKKLIQAFQENVSMLDKLAKEKCDKYKKLSELGPKIDILTEKIEKSDLSSVTTGAISAGLSALSPSSVLSPFKKA